MEKPRRHALASTLVRCHKSFASSQKQITVPSRCRRHLVFVYTALGLASGCEVISQRWLSVISARGWASAYHAGHQEQLKGALSISATIVIHTLPHPLEGRNLSILGPDSRRPNAPFALGRRLGLWTTQRHGFVKSASRSAMIIQPALLWKRTITDYQRLFRALTTSLYKRPPVARFELP